MTDVRDARGARSGPRPLVWWLVALGAAALAAAAFVVVKAFSAGGTSDSAVGTIAIDPARAQRPALFAAARAGDNLVGLRVPTGGPVDLTVVPSDQSTLPLSAVRVRVGGAAAPVRACGTTCFRVAAPRALRAPLAVTVAIHGSGKPAAAATIRLPSRLPPSGDGLLRAVDRRMARVRSFRVDEALSSGVAAIRATFDFAVPGRMRYSVSDGSRAIVVGTRRWDSDNGGPWQESPSPGIHVPSYMWDGAGEPRLVGRGTVRGRPVRIIAAFRPSADFPAWFRLYVARDDRVLQADMIAPAHFMRDSLSRFDRPVPIEPPRPGTKPTVWEQMRPIGTGPRYRPRVLSETALGGRPVGGLACSADAGPEFGAHLELFANGRVVIVPAGIGFARPLKRSGAYVRGGRCAFPVRTVEPTGVLRVRKGVRVTLGQFFRVWGQPLAPGRLAGFRARPGERVRAWVAGRPWRGPLGAIPLRRHAQVVLELNGFVPPHASYLFPPGL
jgi:hypothetical protein